METITLNGVKYDIVDRYETTGHEEWQKYDTIKTTKTREREIFVFMLLIKGKFRFLQKTKIRERLYFWRSQEFDDGWSYQHYWSKWKREWKKEEILN